MGNESPKTRYRNKNSFSVDFSHDLPDKIKPGKTIKLIPVKDNPSKSLADIKTDRNQQEKTDNGNPVQKIQNNSKLKRLTIVNDQLRKQLIKISTQLTQKLKKKKFQVKKSQYEQPNENRKQGWKKQLQNAYKQVDMYKRMLTQFRQSQKIQGRTVILQNKISALDIQITQIQQQITATKKVTSNQNLGIKKTPIQQSIQQSKNQLQHLRSQLKQISKIQRQKQKKYMQQHHYMLALQQKVKQLNNQQAQIKKSRIKQQTKKATQKQIQQCEQELQKLKIKHDQYHRKINSYLSNNRILKQQKLPLKVSLEQKTKLIENLRYKRDALVKVIKDNLYLFAAYEKKQHQEEQVSQFQSQIEQQQEEQEQEIVPVVEVQVQKQEQPQQQQQQAQQQQVQQQPKQPEQPQQRGMFDIDHLLNKNILSKQNLQQRKALRHQQFKSDPKVWLKQLTRTIIKGKKMADQKIFTSGIQHGSKNAMRIVKIHVWMNKKKYITALQPIYLVDGINVQGNKSSNNQQDQYKVTFELEEEDYLKSILGIIGKQGYLDYLVLQSYFGKVSKIGREHTFGENFAVGIAKEETPIIISGANRFDGTHWRISRVEFQVLIESAH